ncbi:MAG: hypothetical protein AAFP78_01395, partial [Pseudomonadota bacterium]
MSGPVNAVSRVASGAFGGIISYFTRHRTAANLLLVLMLVGGFFSATQLRSQYLPDFVIETVTVNV